MMNRLQNYAIRAWARLQEVPPIFVLAAMTVTLLQLACISLAYVVLTDLTYDDYMEHGYRPGIDDLAFFGGTGIVLLVTGASLIGIYLRQRWACAVTVGFQLLFTSGCVAIWEEYDLTKLPIPIIFSVVTLTLLLLPKRSRAWFVSRRSAECHR